MQTEVPTVTAAASAFRAVWSHTGGDEARVVGMLAADWREERGGTLGLRILGCEGQSAELAASHCRPTSI